MQQLIHALFIALFFLFLVHSDFNTPGDILIMGSRQVIIVISRFVLVINVDMCYYFGQRHQTSVKSQKKFAIRENRTMYVHCAMIGLRAA